MITETICKVMGFIAIVLLGIYFIRYIMNVRISSNDRGSSVEGFSSIEGFSQKAIAYANNEVKKNVDHKISKLNLNKKTRIHYEDMLKDLDTIIGGTILTKVTESAETLSSSPDDPKSLAFMAKINTMTAFQESMKNSLHNWLDGHGNSAKSYL